MSSMPEIYRPNLGVSLNDIVFRLQKLEAWAPDLDAQFNIKVTSDNRIFTIGDNKFVFMIPEDLDAWELIAAEAFVSTVGTTATTVQVRNRTQAVDILTAPLTIDANEFTTCTSSSPIDISATNDDVNACDLIAIDIDAAGTSAKGLGVILTFSAPRDEVVL